MPISSDCISKRTQPALNNLFGCIAPVIYKKPWFVCVGGILFTLLCSIGTLYLVEEESIVELWVPRSSTVYDETKLFESYFGNAGPYCSTIIKSTSPQGNLLSTEMVNITQMIFNVTLHNLTITYKNDIYDFESICDRYYDNYPVCESEEESPFEVYFANNANLMSSQYFIDALSDVLAAELSIGYGGLDYDDDGVIQSAKYMSFFYSIEGQDISEKDSLIHDEWMQHCVDYWLENKYYYDDMYNITVYVLSYNSFDDEIGRLISQDINIFIMALVVMCLWLAFTIGKWHDLDANKNFKCQDRCNNRWNDWCIHGRPWLALSTVMIMVCALIVGFGLTGGLFGVPYNTIVLLVPFILLGVGVDDSIIITDCWNNRSEIFGESGEIRLVNTLKHAGISITLTSLCSVSAFLIGSFVDILVVKQFCLYAAMSFFANYLFQFLLFIPLLVIDEKRIINSKNNCFCKMNTNTNTSLPNINQNNNASETDTQKAQRIKSISTVELNTTALDPQTSVSEPQGRSSTTNVKHHQQNSDHDHDHDHLDTGDGSGNFVINRVLLPILHRRKLRIGIIIAFLLMTVLSILSLPYVEVTSDSSEVVPDDSYALDFLDAAYDGWPDVDRIWVHLVFEDVDISSDTFRSRAETLSNVLVKENSGDFESFDVVTQLFNWINEFEDGYLKDKLDFTSDYIKYNLSSSDYYYYLKVFLNTTVYEDDYGGAQYRSNVIFDDYNNPTQLKATRLLLIIETGNQAWSQMYAAYVELNKIIRETFDKNEFFVATYEAFGYGYLVHTLPDLTLQNVVLAAVGVFIILMLLIDIKIAIFILFIVGMIDVTIFGWMYCVGVDLTAISYGEVVMAVGLTVDYVIHVTHAITHAASHEMSSNSKYFDYNNVLTFAMNDMGTSVFKGAWTTLLGAFSLIFSQSAAFRIFFFMFVGIIVSASMHGLIFVPALLGEIYHFRELLPQNAKK